MWSLLATTPSVTLNRVDVGGSTMGTQTTYFAYGYSGQNRPLIEGINTTEGTVGRRASISITARSKRCSSAPPATPPRCRTPAC